MRVTRKILLLLTMLVMIVPSSYKVSKVDYRQARYNNVCKDLKGDVLLYFVFIDSKYTTPWTEFDIQSTIDSIRTAIIWLQLQAKDNHVPLNIIADFYIGPEYTTISRNLPGATVLESVTEPNSTKVQENMKRWSDGVAKIAGQSVTLREKDGIPDVKAPKNKERLIAFLRDENNVESVALFYLVNNYFKSDISIPVNSFTTDDLEYVIVSYKYPSEIAHNFLHLYGAADMYETLLRKSERNIRTLAGLYPDEIMQEPYGKDLEKLSISDYTKYLIGWTDNLDPSLEPLMKDKMTIF
ncbi:hypothetical protein ACFLSP_01500 [Bacteroidota bacterium]